MIFNRDNSLEIGKLCIHLRTRNTYKDGSTFIATKWSAVCSDDQGKLLAKVDDLSGECYTE